MEPILKTAVLILMKQTRQRLIWGLLARKCSQALLEIDKEGSGSLSCAAATASRTDSSRGDLVGEREGVKDTQQHPGRGFVRSLAQR